MHYFESILSYDEFEIMLRLITFIIKVLHEVDYCDGAVSLEYLGTRFIDLFIIFGEIRLEQLLKIIYSMAFIVNSQHLVSSLSCAKHKYFPIFVGTPIH